MSDYCVQCVDDIFGPEADTDLSGLSTKENTDNGLFPVVICEGCGYIQVDHLGNCVSKDCLEEHNG